MTVRSPHPPSAPAAAPDDAPEDAGGGPRWVTDPASPHPAAQTPMMRQYLDAKLQHPEAIVLFRMGDFYETFFQDAIDAAHLLELTLTSRNKADDAPIPMAGVPHHAAAAYIRRLLEAGRKVAVCEQVEDPREAKGLVRREVVRVVTPGLVLDDDVLESRSNNYLAALWRDAAHPEAGVGLAWVDASTGEVRGTQAPDLARALDELTRIDPAEVLVDRGDAAAVQAVRAALERAVLSATAAPTGEDDAVSSAAAMVTEYVAEMQKGGALPLRPLERQPLDGVMRLGPATVRNLELVRSLADGRRQGSLLALLDQTRTAMGGRLLKQWLLFPLLDVEAIRARHDAVAALVDDPRARALVREALAGVYDLERLVTRAVAGTAGPRDLMALAGSLERIPDLAATLAATGAPALTALAAALDPVPEASAAVRRALVDDPPATLKEGGVIREGCHPELDELLSIARDGKSWFNDYAARLREDSGIASLKIRYNNVFGYFIEVTKANLHHVPPTWLRKQTLANAERYYTPELKEREDKVLGADERRVALEQELFEAVRAEVAAHGARIQAAAGAIARLDALAGLAELAHRRGYVRPQIEDSLALRVEGGRHPVIESLLPAGEFVPNDVSFDASEAGAEGPRLVVITGPNMAGKSTVMRQVALIVVMAQMGSFVPADHAVVGLVDQVFTRVGASDDLARGRSTFMVEMTETASILTEATSRSLVVVDEIGRGTSTYDGVSIAWAVAEHLHDVTGARTLFATHYHELTELAATRPRVANMTIAVKEWKEDIIFLRRLVAGGANRSYGIQVARLAGLPTPVVARATEILANLEAVTLDRDSRPRLARGQRRTASSIWQLNLFANSPAPAEAPPAGPPDALTERLRAVDPDRLTPRAALDLVYELRALLARQEAS